MFSRDITTELAAWIKKDNRKPLVLRGARQVGKTTIIKELGKLCKQFIYLNLELPEDKIPFEQFTTMETLIQTIFLIKNKHYSERQHTLVFIDEIQEYPPALNMLRYFFEQQPEIPVIAAGSTLESLFDKNIHFPVGRVEFKVLRPASFVEFLGALDEKLVLEKVREIPLPVFAHNVLLKLFHTYAIIGGMPEIVSHYAKYKDITALSSIYDSLITAYLDDVEKYAVTTNQVQLIRHAITTSFQEAGKRITYEGFGNSGYRSRDMGEALRTLEKAFLIQLIFPQTGATLPLAPDLKKKPRLQVLDTGMLNYFAAIQSEIIQTQDLGSVYKGTMIEHLVGQEILSHQYLSLSRLNYWVREKSTSTAEVDFLYVFEGKLIPVEVKSGVSGKLKSLHLFMDMAPHNMAIRFYSGEIDITEIITAGGKKYHLLSLPYYLVSQLDNYLEWFQKKISPAE
ncbi:MAG: AAA family ATPase [Bacteroidota bacterium]